MDRETRPVFVSVLLITTLSIPVAATIVAAALICVLKTVKISFAAVDKFSAYSQHELQLFNELYEDNQASAWDELNLLAAFTKGEDVLGCRQRKKNLRPKAEKKNKAVTMIITRGDRGIAMTSTVKRPMIGQSYLRQLLRQRPYDALHFYSRFTKNDSLSLYQGSQDCAKIDAIMSDSCCLMANDIVTGADQLRAGNGTKAHSNETSRAPLCAHGKVHFQVKGAIQK